MRIVGFLALLSSGPPEGRSKPVNERSPRSLLARTERESRACDRSTHATAGALQSRGLPIAGAGRSHRDTGDDPFRARERLRHFAMSVGEESTPTTAKPRSIR